MVASGAACASIGGATLGHLASRHTSTPRGLSATLLKYLLRPSRAGGITTAVSPEVRQPIGIREIAECGQCWQAHRRAAHRW